MPSALKGRYRLFQLLVLAPFVLFVLWECGHYARFGDFFSYGYHTDLVVDNSDIGVPRLYTSYCLRVSNYTVHRLRFETIRMPPGFLHEALLYHERLEKWDQQAHRWFKIFDSEESDTPPLNHPNSVRIVLPGGSIYPTGCYEIATVEGIHKGDVVRLVAFTSYSKAGGDNSPLVFYSPAFTIQEESPKKSFIVKQRSFMARLNGVNLRAGCPEGNSRTTN